MKELLARQKVTEGKITVLVTQMVLTAQTSLKKMKDIVECNQRLEMLTQLVVHMKLTMDKVIMKVKGNTNAIRFLAFMLGRISAVMESNLSK